MTLAGYIIFFIMHIYLEATPTVGHVSKACRYLGQISTIINQFAFHVLDVWLDLGTTDSCLIALYLW